MEATRTATCKMCGHKGTKVVEATERQTYKYGYDYHAGEYFVGTCPACQMRDCHHVSELAQAA